MPDVAGLRVLRLLARGDRADSMVAFDPGGEADGDDADGEAVVIKRFHPTTPPADVSRELEALARAAGAHVVALRDVGSEAGCACLIFERLPGGDLSTLLRMRGSLDAGEVVTVLAPIATALARMHAAGVALGSVAASSILFTEDGSPTLIGFGGAELFAPGSPEVVLESVPAVAADREALRILAVSLLERIADSAGVASDLAATIAGAAPHDLADVVGSRIFELGAPAPVRFESDEAAGSTRVVPVAEPVAESPSQQTGVLTRWEPVARLLDQDLVVGFRRELVERWRALTPKFRRVVIAAVAGVGVLLISLAATPPPADAPQAAPPTADQIAPITTDAAPDPELSGDDPIAAAVVLLALREECLRSASLLCLDGVVQAGSSAEAADRAAVGVIQGGGEAPRSIAASRLELVERLGDSALVTLGSPSEAEKGPASLLLMKGEAGWRIRDYIPSTPTP